MEQSVQEKLIKAGKIAQQTVSYAKNFVKKDMLLVEIAEKIEAKILELGGKPAFPVNLSINEVAAHATPLLGDTTKSHGLLKVDIGAQCEGYVADTAFSIDLENDAENKKLIEVATEALEKAVDLVKKKKNVQIREIGACIAETMKAKNIQPVSNLSGHSIENYTIHAGITIPNYDNAQEKKLQTGVYAIEPFATTGVGLVRDGKPSGIYVLNKEGQVRDTFAREVREYIKKEYSTLPFCARWLQKKYGSRVLIALKRLEEAGLVHQYAQLIEKSGHKVAQAEHTVIITDKEVIITTKEK